MKRIKIKKITKVENEPTYDIQIADSHHYILENGVISHNSQDLFPKAIQSGGKGVDYSASTIVYLTKAKLKTGNEDDNDLGASGIIVTALARKNRNAKPKKIKFEINHTTGTNKYTGLEMFCTLENFEKIGIAKVKPDVDKKTGEITYKASAGKWYVKHLDKTFYDKQLFTSKVFTQEILEIINPIAIDYFSYGSQEEIEKTEAEMNEMYQEFEEDDEFDIDSDNDGQLFD